MTLTEQDVRDIAERIREAGGVVVKADCRNPVCPTIRNIVIEDNMIDCPKAAHGSYVRNVSSVTVLRNRIVSRGEPIHIEKCSGVEVQQEASVIHPALITEKTAVCTLIITRKPDLELSGIVSYIYSINAFL